MADKYPYETKAADGDFKVDGDTGEVKAVLATLNVVDRQGDRIMPGAVGKQDAVIGGYGHSSIRDGVPPVGKGIVEEQDGKLVFTGKISKELQGGQEMITMLKEIGSLQEWSFGLWDVDYAMVREDGEYIYELRKFVAKEVSPVMRGASIGSRTISIKDEATDPVMEKIKNNAVFEEIARQFERTRSKYA